MSARKKAKSSPEPLVPEAEKPQEERNLASETGIKKPAEVVNEASTPVAKMPPEEGIETPTPEIEPPVRDGGSNDVDKHLAGTEIVLSGGDPEVLDVTIEEPDYPVHEWHDGVDAGLVVPDEAMADETLSEGILQMQGRIAVQLRRTLPEHWMIGKALNILFARHGHDKILIDPQTGKSRRIRSGWRKDWLPKYGYNHTSDQQLRVLAETYSLEEVQQFANKTEALRACGFSVGRMTKAIETDKNGAAQGNAIPGVTGKKAAKKAMPQPKDQANGIASQAPHAQPFEEDPIAEAEALVVTLIGTEVADMEAVIAGSGINLLAKNQDQIVGLLWYADDSYKVAKEKVENALAKLRAGKKTVQVEAHYLYPGDLIAV